MQIGIESTLMKADYKKIAKRALKKVVKGNSLDKESLKREDIHESKSLSALREKKLIDPNYDYKNLRK